MLKKDIRKRKDYLYKKQEELKQKLIYEKKNKLKKEIEKNEENTSLVQSKKFYKKNKDLIHSIEADDIETHIPYSIVDDEYRQLNYTEPKIIMTTSRDCSNRLQQFMQELRLIFPNSYKLNRGNLVLKELVEIAKEKEFTDIILLHENKGQPDGMIISHLPFGPTIYIGLFNVVLRHDIKELNTVSEAYPHLIFDGFKTSLGERVTTILKNLFPVPKLDSPKVMTFSNKEDVIHFRHHSFEKKNGSNECRPQDVELTEQGPRFDMLPYQIVLGTLDMPDAQKEWVIRPYINTAKKNYYL